MEDILKGITGVLSPEQKALIFDLLLTVSHKGKDEEEEEERFPFEERTDVLMSENPFTGREMKKSL